MRWRLEKEEGGKESKSESRQLEVMEVEVGAEEKRREEEAFELEWRTERSVGGRRRKKEGCFGAEKVRYGYVWYGCERLGGLERGSKCRGIHERT